MENSAPTANALTQYNISETLQAKLSQLLNCTDKRQEEQQRNQLNMAELKVYDDMLQRRIQELSQQQEMLMSRMSGPTNTPNNELTRETNQRKIHTAMDRLLKLNGQMPTKSQIAEVTGLSRKTVSKHMAEHAQSGDMLNQLAMMAPHVMNTVLQKALNDQDMHAARLYMKVTGDMWQQQATRANYISIDTTIISQAYIDGMSKEHQAMILQLINKMPEVDSIEP